MHDSCFRVIDSWNSWVISTIASSWLLISQSIHRSRWCFFPGSRIPLHRFCRADTADPTAEWPSRQSSRGALRFPWFPLRKGSGWNGCQGGMERSSVFQDKCLTDSLRILKEGSMLKWSYIYNTSISLSFVFSLLSSYPTLTGYHPYPFEEGEIFNAAFWPATGLQGSPAPGRGIFGGEDKLRNQS